MALNIILLGPPGCGKGTQASILAEKYGMYKLSTGDLVRAEIASGSEIGVKVKQVVDSGQFPDDEIILSLIETKVKTLVSDGASIIFDGVPRTLNQAKKLDQMLNEMGAKITHVIELKVSEQALVDRITGRFTCASCGAVYNEHFLKPKKEGVCDQCGSTEFKRRSDDTEDVIRERLRVYRNQTEPLVAYYDEKGILAQVNGLLSIEEIAQSLEAHLSPQVPKKEVGG